MSKRKLEDEILISPVVYKRRRRVSDVIDSHGIDSIAAMRTPKRAKEKFSDAFSPDAGYSSSVSTPETSKNCEVTPEPTKQKATKVPEVDYPYGNMGSLNELHCSKMVTEKDSELYKMNHPNRGKCVVFNHEVFDNNANREGSSNDARKIKETFEKLGFQVIIFDNLKHSEVIQCINNLSKEDHSQSDCICIFMLTHGTFDDLIYAKDVAYKADDIWKPFTADKCKTLAGKPKLFFFQNCRGNQLDGGTVLHSMTTRNDSHVKSYKIPNHADFLVAHSTVQGFYSWRNPAHGTWYVQTLCEVIDKHYQNTDLLKMLTITARRIATDYASYNDLNPFENNQKQVPSVSSMLIRDVYFA